MPRNGKFSNNGNSGNGAATAIAMETKQDETHRKFEEEVIDYKDENGQLVRFYGGGRSFFDNGRYRVTKPRIMGLITGPQPKWHPRMDVRSKNRS